MSWNQHLLMFLLGSIKYWWQNKKCSLSAAQFVFSQWRIVYLTSCWLFRFKHSQVINLRYFTHHLIKKSQCQKLFTSLFIHFIYFRQPIKSQFWRKKIFEWVKKSPVIIHELSMMDIISTSHIAAFIISLIRLIGIFELRNVYIQITKCRSIMETPFFLMNWHTCDECRISEHDHPWVTDNAF